MTVEELIKELEKLPMDFKVMVHNCYYDTPGDVERVRAENDTNSVYIE